MNTINDEFSVELVEWAFPEVDMLIWNDEVDLGSIFIPDIPNNELVSANDINNDIAVNQTESEDEQLIEPEVDENEIIEYQVLDKLKVDVESRIELLGQIVNQLKKPVSLINEELIELLQDIIKKIVKKIIFKEVTTDTAILPNMINELKSLIDTKNGMTSVFLSPQDYNHLEADKHFASGLIEIDHSLSVGDIIIKSNYAEVRALLDERIEQVIRIEND